MLGSTLRGRLTGATKLPKPKGVVSLRKALYVGVYGEYEDRKTELEALLKASTLGFDKVLTNNVTDETVYLVEGEYFEGTVDPTDEDTLEQSLRDAGYELVDLLDYLKERQQ